MHNRRIAAVTAAMALAALLAACSTSNQALPPTKSAGETTAAAQETIAKPQTKSAPLTIAYVPITMNTQYSMTQYGMQEEIDKLGGTGFATLDVQAPTSNDTSLQQQPDILENLIAKGVDAIVLSTEDEKALLPYIERAEKAGIAVFLTNMAATDPTDLSFVSNVGYSQYDASFAIGKWTVDHFKGSDARIAVLEGYPGLLNDQRVKGFHDAIKDSPKLSIVASESADWTRAKGQEVTENIVTAHPDINMVYGLYDEMALGAVTTIKSAGLLNKIIVAGYDNTADGNAAVKAGELTVTVDTGSKQVGVEIIKAINAFLVKGQPVKRDILVDPKIYDSANVGTFDTNNFVYVPQKPVGK